MQDCPIPSKSGRFGRNTLLQSASSSFWVKLAYFGPFRCLIWAKLVLGLGILNFRAHFSNFYVWFEGSHHACYL